GACRSGAIVANAPDEKENELKDYGYQLGMAFQMADDLLDYTATAEELGKNPGADIREGKLTLPLIHSLENAGPEDREWILSVIKDTEFDPDRFAGLRDKISDLGGIAYTEERAVRHVETARNALSVFEDSPSKTLLGLIADYSIQRKV
ncbi:MAG: polyprenyl synthetase family protein, partial [Desulfobacterales bacterium]|nr:polyprenyl synthetase family protein [Desulfobacterales bacterium]